MSIYKTVVLIILVLSFVFFGAGCNVTVKSHGFIKSYGAELYYESYGKGTPIIVVHGGPGDDHNYLKPQLRDLASSFSVIFYDQRGSGRSLNTQLTRRSINLDNFIEDIESIRKHFHLDKFIILGHSWGGFLAAAYAIKYPDKLTGLIIADAAPVYADGQKLFLKDYENRLMTVNNARVRLKTYENFSKLTAREIAEAKHKIYSTYFYDKRNLSKLYFSVNLASARSGYKVAEIINQHDLFKPNINLLKALKELSVPTLILHGQHDIVPIEIAEMVHKTIKGSDLVIFDKSGHFPFVEQQRMFIYIIKNFIKNIRMTR